MHIVTLVVECGRCHRFFEFLRFALAVDVYAAAAAALPQGNEQA